MASGGLTASAWVAGPTTPRGSPAKRGGAGRAQAQVRPKPPQGKSLRWFD